MLKHPSKTLLPIIAMIALIISACGAGNTETPTEPVSAIYTAAAQTIEAQAALATATPKPSNTAQPTQTPTATATAAATTAPASSITQNYCDNSVYIADVTIPDHTEMTQGQAFDKTWTLQNTGTCTWTTGYTIVFVSGEQMTGNSRAINQTVGPQQQINVTVKLTAPNKTGEFSGYWRMANGKGEKFGQLVSVVINVPANGGATATATITGAPTTAATSTPSSTPTVTIEPSATPSPTATPTR